MSHWRYRSLALALISLLLYPTSVTAATIFSENFETNNSEFTFSAPDSLWHITSNFPFSGNRALAYVQHESASHDLPDGEYDAGFQDDYVISPEIILAAQSVLKFEAFVGVEVAGVVDVADRLSVWASFDGPNFNPLIDVLLASSTPISSGVTSIAEWSGPGSQSYVPISIDLGPFAELPVNVVFRFETIDDNANRFPGIRIDNVIIEVPVPEPHGGVILAAGLVVLPLLKIRRRVSLRLSTDSQSTSFCPAGWSR